MRRCSRPRPKCSAAFAGLRRRRPVGDQRIVRLGPALESGRGQVRHSARRDSAHQLLRQALLPGEPGAGVHAPRRRREYVQSRSRRRATTARSSIAAICRTSSSPAERSPSPHARRRAHSGRGQRISRRARATPPIWSGPEWTFGYGALTGQLNALREVTGEHDGYEVRAALAAPLLRSKGSLVASAGLTWKSAELVRYYYGVDELYEPGSALSPFVKLRYALPAVGSLDAQRVRSLRASAGLHRGQSCRFRKPCHDRICRRRFPDSLAPRERPAAASARCCSSSRAAAPRAPTKRAAIKLELSPRICTLSAGDESCDTVVTAQWRAPRDESLCLLIVGPAADPALLGESRGGRLHRAARVQSRICSWSCGIRSCRTCSPPRPSP